MKKQLSILFVLISLLSISFAQAATNWEVRRLKNGTCGVAQIKPGVKAGSNRVAGPFPTKKLKSTPRCKRF